MGWLFIKKHPDVVTSGRELDFTDLMEDVTVMFQKKLDPWFALYMCYVMPAQVASHYWGENLERSLDNRCSKILRSSALHVVCK